MSDIISNTLDSDLTSLTLQQLYNFPKHNIGYNEVNLLPVTWSQTVIDYVEETRDRTSNFISFQLQ